MSARRSALLVLSIAFAAPLHADDECGGYALHGDPLFGAIDGGAGGRATVLHDPNDAQACAESAACVERVFPSVDTHDGVHDGCPFGFGSDREDGCAQSG